MVNPMGWYDERGGTPLPSPGHTPRSLNAQEEGAPIAQDHAVPSNKASSRVSALGLSIMDEKARRDGTDGDPDQVFTDSPPPMDHPE